MAFFSRQAHLVLRRRRYKVHLSMGRRAHEFPRYRIGPFWSGTASWPYLRRDTVKVLSVSVHLVLRRRRYKVHLSMGGSAHEFPRYQIGPFAHLGRNSAGIHDIFSRQAHLVLRRRRYKVHLSMGRSAHEFPRYRIGPNRILAVTRP